MSQIYYKEYGGGYPLIFLHGFCETHHVWENLAEYLQADFHVICPDLPGFGKTSLFSTDFSLKNVAREMKIWLHELSIQKCLIFGHSLGGYITLAMVEQYPELTKGFCLFNSSAFADSDDKKENRNKLIEHIKKHGTASFIETFVPSLFYDKRADEFQRQINEIRKEGLKIAPETIIAYAAAMRDRPDYTAILKSNGEKALIIAGEEDQNVPKTVSQKLGEMIDKQNFHLLPASAHMSMFEQTAKAAGIIRKFADRLLTPPEVNE